MVRPIGELIVAAGITSNLFTGPGAGWTRRILTQPDGDILEDSTSSAPGPRTANATGDAGRWIMEVVAFR